MSKFQLFDAVSLTEPIALADRPIAPPETAGAIIEIFKNGEAYLVELFGGWVIAIFFKSVSRGTGVSPVHDLWYGRLTRTSSAVKIFIDKKVRSPIPSARNGC